MCMKIEVIPNLFRDTTCKVYNIVVTVLWDAETSSA